MKKFIIGALALVAFGFASAFAAAPVAPAAGKVLAIEANKVQVVLDMENPAWVRKGAVVKVTNEAGEVVVTAGKIIAVTAKGFTFTTKEAADLPKDAKLTFQKGRIMSGC
jgi:hypothetical protein